MRIRLVVDGEKQELEVDLAKGEARLGGRTVPFRVLEDQGPKVEIEVGGERHVLDGWPSDRSTPPGNTLVVNRERYRVDVEEVEAGPRTQTLPFARTGGPSPTPSPVPAGSPSSPSSASGPGVAITPPMPGKVLEVRVHEGDTVTVGQTLLVLEAMKMRNEVQSPTAGKVVALAAVPGAMVKAREVMLRIVPP